jgi:hypothetical protein
MNGSFGRPGGFLKRLIRVNVLGHPVGQDPDRAVSRFVEAITLDEDGETRILGVQNNLCDCGAIIQEKGNALLGYCSCGALVCESCARRCSECNALSCPRCSAQAILGDEVFCGRCRGGAALIKRILIGRPK